MGAFTTGSASPVFSICFGFFDTLLLLADLLTLAAFGFTACLDEDPAIVYSSSDSLIMTSFRYLWLYLLGGAEFKLLWQQRGEGEERRGGGVLSTAGAPRLHCTLSRDHHHDARRCCGSTVRSCAKNTTTPMIACSLFSLWYRNHRYRLRKMGLLEHAVRRWGRSGRSEVLWLVVLAVST